MRLSSTYICLFGVLHLCLIGCQPKLEETDTDTSTETDTDSDTDTDTAPPAFPDIALSETVLNLGQVEWGCSESTSVMVSNVGTADLEIASLALGTATVFTLSSASGPLTVAPGDEVEVTLVLAGLYADVGLKSDVLTVGSNDPDEPSVTVDLSGEIMDGDTHVQQHTSLADQVDILFSFDRSCGMFDDAIYLSQTFPTFVEALNGLGTDYQVAVTVADDGCVVGGGGWIDSTVPPSDTPARVETMIDITGATAPPGMNPERAFSLMEAALEEAKAGGCNHGFLRPAADLILVGVSDEPEQSPNPWSYYVSDFESRIDPAAHTTFNALGSDGCNYGLGAPAYYNFDGAVTATGGVTLDLCEATRPTDLKDLAAHSRGKKSLYPLEYTPGADPTVTVDGSPTSGTWVYESMGNAVRFNDDAIPPSGATVEMTYPISSCL